MGNFHGGLLAARSDSKLFHGGGLDVVMRMSNLCCQVSWPVVPSESQPETNGRRETAFLDKKRSLEFETIGRLQ